MNWTGTYTATNAAGTATSGSTTSLTFTGAGWTTNHYANMWCRILAGTNAGLERLITSNTGDVLTVDAFPDAIDNTSVFEIVLIFKDQDHITGNVTVGAFTWEKENSSTQYVDGNYVIGGSSAVGTKWKWAKTESTLGVIETNNFSTSTAGAWQYLNIITSTAGTPPEVQYIKLRGCANTLVHTVYNSGLSDMTGVHHLWFDNTTAGTSLAGTVDADVTYSNILVTNGRSSIFRLPPTVSGTTTHTIKDCWIDGYSGYFQVYRAGAVNRVYDKVVCLAQINAQDYLASGATVTFQDSYISAGKGVNDGIIVGQASTSDAGTQVFTRNVTMVPRPIYGANDGTGAMKLSFNDMYGNPAVATRAIDILGAYYFTTATSDNDYIDGFNLAVVGNVDTSEFDTSGESPEQYRNLTVYRTNAKATPNKPLTIDNVVEGTPDESSITITFDCENGTPYSPTINADSNSGQANLNVSSTKGFQERETVEIGKGTARYEKGVVSSITSGGIDLSTVIMLHGDGSDGSQTFTDESGKTWTAYGDAQIDTAVKEFGTGSMLFDGTGDYIDTPDSGDFYFSNSDFTIDFWFNTTQTTDGLIFGQASSAGSDVSVYARVNDTADKLNVGITDGTAQFIVSSTSVNDGAWHHCAIVRYQNGLNLYVDGVSEGTPLASLGAVPNRTTKFAIGRLGEYDGSYFAGSIDEFRVTLGIARWTTNFTPPTSAYTESGVVTLTANLTNSHTAVQADVVQKRLRHTGLPFIKYGTTTGIYDKQTILPPADERGKIYTGIITSYNGSSVSFKQDEHSVTIRNLEAGTTYYYKACAMSPLGQLLESTEGTFTTASLASGGESSVAHFT